MVTNCGRISALLAYVMASVGNKNFIGPDDVCEVVGSQTILFTQTVCVTNSRDENKSFQFKLL